MLYVLKIAALILLGTVVHSADFPNIEGRWNMDADNIKVLLDEHKGILTTSADALVKELIEDKDTGKDIVFKGDMIAFVNGEKLVQKYKMRLFYASDKTLLIEIYNRGPTDGMVRILDIKGDQMVFRDPGYNNKFDMFRAYRRVRE
jgi:hypothetical protein